MILRKFFLLCFLSFGSFLIAVPEHSFDKTMEFFEKRIATMKNILKDGKEYLKEHTISQSCSEFSSNSKWRIEDINLVILDEDGVGLLVGGEKAHIWKDFSEYKDEVGNLIIKKAFATPENEYSFIILNLNNSRMFLMGTKFKKGKKNYVLCCGFYPVSPEYLGISLMSVAMELIQNIGLEQTLVVANNMQGVLVEGDIFSLIIDQDGKILAKADDHSQVGFNIFKKQGFDGTEFKKFLDSSLVRTWIDFKYNRTIARAYCMKYFDKKNEKTYLICFVYYPEITDESVLELIQRASTYLKAVGLEEACYNFNSKSGSFYIGGSRISVYDFDGLCLANGEDPSFVGHNVLERRTQDGQLYMQDMINEVKKFGVSYIKQIDRNGYKLVYSESLDLPEGKFIVSSGYWPHSSSFFSKNMVERAVREFAKNSLEEAFIKISGLGSNYLYGNNYVVVWNSDGIVMNDGPYNKNNIWKKVEHLNNFGRSIFDVIDVSAIKGGGWISYQIGNSKYRVYNQQISLKGSNDKLEYLTILSGYRE